MTTRNPGFDPRLNAKPDDGLALDDLQPIVGRAAGQGGALLIGGIFVAAAAVLFLVLNSHRTHGPLSSLVTPAAEVAAVSPPAQSPPPPLRLPAPAAPPPPAPVAPQPTPLPIFAAATAPLPPAPLAGATADGAQHLKAPTMVVDLGAASAEPARLEASTSSAANPTPTLASSAASPSGASGSSAAGAGALAGAAGGAQIGGDDQFAQRVGDERPARSRAVTMRNLDTLVSQGTIIPAALETAIDSDLPGYTRAVVSRDVLSFDGKNVLIPRGSRVIGQYKSAVSLGASRAFVIWTRIIRSDGVSIQIGSPGTDTLGRGGLSGEVNRHFFARFGGSILLSVLNAGLAAVSRAPITTISISSAGAAVGAANGIQPDSIPPTIKVAQGSAVNIFVARDLDFSDVAAVK